VSRHESSADNRCDAAAIPNQIPELHLGTTRLLALAMTLIMAACALGDAEQSNASTIATRPASSSSGSSASSEGGSQSDLPPVLGSFTAWLGGGSSVDCDDEMSGPLGGQSEDPEGVSGPRVLNIGAKGPTSHAAAWSPIREQNRSIAATQPASTTVTSTPEPSVTTTVGEPPTSAAVSTTTSLATEDPATTPSTSQAQEIYFGPLFPVLGSVMHLCALGFPSGEIHVEVTHPNGSVTFFTAHPYSDHNTPTLSNPLGGDDLASTTGTLSWFVPSEIQPGTYTFTAIKDDVQLMTEIDLVWKAGPWIEQIAGRATPGGAVSMALSGLPPDSLVPLAIYKLSQDSIGEFDGVFELFEQLDPVRVNGNGAARLELAIDDTFAPGTYCLSGPHFAEGLTRAGDGWTVCDAEADGWFSVG
jgi:hypothetical protein